MNNFAKDGQLCLPYESYDMINTDADGLPFSSKPVLRLDHGGKLKGGGGGGREEPNGKGLD